VIGINFAGTALTGCGLNPSEILGIAIVTNQAQNWNYVWIYVAGPVTGALIIGTVLFNSTHFSLIQFDLI
jgi:glycerol uptake facilitator-like aquaporin